MPKRKETVIAVSVNEPDTKHHQNSPIYNFICQESNLENAFILMDKEKFFNEKIENVKSFLKQNRNLYDKPFLINLDLIYIEEVKISKPFKSFDDYIYQITDYDGMKQSFVNFNDTIKEIDKKIKNKYVRVSYDGNNEKLCYSKNEIANILSRMSNDTHEVSLCQIKGNGEDDNLIIITPHKVIK